MESLGWKESTFAVIVDKTTGFIFLRMFKPHLLHVSSTLGIGLAAGVVVTTPMGTLELPAWASSAESTH